jgi:hypothetical protein
MCSYLAFSEQEHFRESSSSNVDDRLARMFGLDRYIANTLALNPELLAPFSLMFIPTAHVYFSATRDILASGESRSQKAVKSAYNYRFTQFLKAVQAGVASFMCSYSKFLIDCLYY